MLRKHLVFIKFLASSLASSAVDLALFALLSPLLKGLGVARYILVATALARVVSCLVNYAINHKKVFRDNAPVWLSLLKYAGLNVAKMLLSAGLVSLWYSLWPLAEVLIKAVVDSVLFFINFLIQRRFVFTGPGDAKREA